jgi:hypothetical protein
LYHENGEQIIELPKGKGLRRTQATSGYVKLSKRPALDKEEAFEVRKKTRKPPTELAAEINLKIPVYE